MGTLGEIATVAPAFWLARRSECPERQTAAQFPRFQADHSNSNNTCATMDAELDDKLTKLDCTVKAKSKWEEMERHSPMDTNFSTQIFILQWFAIRRHRSKQRHSSLVTSKVCPAEVSGQGHYCPAQCKL
ncbi:hypothetical protein ABBQ32_002954 [Trebouxia sp. C0010 RCD-2024]